MVTYAGNQTIFLRLLLLTIRIWNGFFGFFCFARGNFCSKLPNVIKFPEQHSSVSHNREVFYKTELEKIPEK